MTKKKYNDYIVTRSEQLDLFSFDNLFNINKDKYTNSVELYDLCPKYYYDDFSKIRENGKYIDIIKREFIYKKSKLTLQITPALLKQKDGTSRAFLPTQREEIIEDVLRKIATDKTRNAFLDDRLAVRFTLYDLYKELKKVKHTYSYTEIKESLEVLSGCLLEIKGGTTNSNITFKSAMFETFGKVEEEPDNPEKTTYFVRFNSLVSESIKNNSWQLLNYDICMKYKKAISRWLFKRISHLFLQATIEMPYTILLTTIIRDSGMKLYSRLKDNQRQIVECLEEMKNIGSIEKYEMERIMLKNKLIDVKFFIYISQRFQDDIQLGNYIKKPEAKDKLNISHNKPNKQIKQEIVINDNDILASIEKEPNESIRSVKKKIFDCFGAGTYKSWFAELTYLIDGDSLIIKIESEFMRQYITNNFLSPLKRVVGKKVIIK